MVFRKYKPVKQWGKMDTRIFKEIFNSRNKRRMPSFVVPEGVEAVKAKVYDRNDPFLFENQIKQDVHLEAKAPFTEPEITQHPLYKSAPAFVFEGAEAMSDGVAQAQVLTNCVVKHGLPEVVLQHSAKIEVDESLVKDAILHGEKYDPTLEKLPERFDPILFWIKHVRVHGTPVIKRNNIILNNLVRHVQFAGIHNGSLKDPIQVVRDSPISAIIRNENLFASSPFVVRGQPHLTLQTRDSIVNRPWAGPNDIEAYSQELLPDIYPLSPVIDLQKDNLYNDDVLVPQPTSKQHHIHSILWSREQNQKYPWTREQNLANALLQTYGAAVAQATRAGKTTLEKPILVRGAQLVDGRLDLVAFQLNSLDSSVKNLAWVEKGVRLYQPKPYFEQMVEVEKLDMNVFKKFASLFLGFGSAHAH